MSQTALTNFFQARKRSVPEQHAAKKRKVVLDKYQIENILENGNNDDESTTEEEEFEECQNIINSQESSDQKDESSHSDNDEFKECIEPVNEIAAPECDSTDKKFDVDKKDFDFIDDEEWESLANKTVDETLEERKVLNVAPAEDEVVVFPSREMMSSVTTSALDNHNILIHPELDTASTLATQEQGQGTPSSHMKRENFRKSKRDGKEGKWTPKSSTETLFTVGCGEPVKSAKKKLNMSVSTKNVVFQKLSTLSPKKRVQDKFNSPRQLDYESLSLKLTPHKNDISPFKKPGFSKNLFADSPARISPTKPDLGLAIKQAKTLQAKVTPAEVKAKLGKVKLADLKSRLASLSNSSLKAAEVKASTKSILPKLSSSITLQLDIPSSPSKRVPPSPHKSPFKASPRKLPAYQRYHNLARPADRTLPLPYSYRFLAEVFRCTDTVVSMLNNRKEVINLDKVSKSVTDLLRKRWDVKYLQQILCVFPQAYKLAWESVEGRFCNSEQRELKLRPNMTYKRDLMGELEGKMNNFARMLPEHMVERRDIFRNSLVELVKDHHEEFLASLDPPIVADRNALTSWHKDYDTESAPEIDTVELPQEPGKVAAGATATEALNKAAGLAGVNPKLSDVLRVASVKVEESDTKVAATMSPLKAPSSTTAGLAGLNPALIAKIKAKEAARAKLEMTRNPEQVKLLGQLAKLPELARMIRNLFISEKKAALEVQFVCKKLTSCLPYGTEQATVEENLRLLNKVSKGWVKIHLVGTAEYFKMDKTDINKVCMKLEQKLKEAQKK